MPSDASTPVIATALCTGKTLVDASGGNDESHSVAILETGTILMAGLTSDGQRTDYAEVSLTADGQRNFSYNYDGINRLPAVSPIAAGDGLAAQTSGQILSSQVLYDNDTYALSISTLTGTLNQRPLELVSVPLGEQSSAPIDTTVQTLEDGTHLASARTETALTLAHFNDQGTLDPAFGQEGAASFALPDQVHFDDDTPLTLQSDGKLVLAGYSNTGAQADFSVTRYLPDGSLDQSFSADGQVTIDLAGGSDRAHAVAQQADGKLLIAGSSDTGNGQYDFSVVRLNANGSLDTSFGNGGKATFDFDAGRDSAQTLTVLDDGKILLTGTAESGHGDADFAALRLNADGSLDTTFGDLADGRHHIDGQASNDLLVGTADNEIISGLAGNDLVDGGGGRDVLSGGLGSDVFRFSSIEDSYRTATTSFSDYVTDADLHYDAVDLTALGFTGFGDGYDGTLAVRRDAEADRTYLKSFEYDAQGHRFEVAFQGELDDQWLETNVAFARFRLNDTSSGDGLYAGNVSAELYGHGGDDNLHGNLADDIMAGGGGRDLLGNSAGADTYRFTSLLDSYRDQSHSFTDRITRFDVFEDHIDVSKLGFTGLGNGHDGTLAVTVNDTGTQTYLKSYDANAQGQRFEVTLVGDLSHTLTSEAFIFAHPDQDAAAIELLGAMPATPTS